jgi:hypothetical protein
MQMIQCPNCGKLTGFKRALGFGTFFMVVITGGLWLLAILFYPLRCIACGLTSSDARGSRGALAIVFILILAAMFGIFTHTGKRSDSAARSATITLASLHREVTLSGTVVDEPSRELAEDIASHVPGVVAVHNNLKVGSGAKPF